MKKIIFLFATILLLSTSCTRQKYQAALLATMNEINKECPMYIDEVTTCSGTDYSIGSPYFTYNYTIDEDVCPMSLIVYAIDEIAQNVKSSIVSITTEDFLEACIKADVMIRFQYTGNTSGEWCSVIYNPTTEETETVTESEPDSWSDILEEYGL